MAAPTEAIERGLNLLTEARHFELKRIMRMTDASPSDATSIGADADDDIIWRRGQAGWPK